MSGFQIVVIFSFLVFGWVGVAGEGGSPRWVGVAREGGVATVGWGSQKKPKKPEVINCVVFIHGGVKPEIHPARSVPGHYGITKGYFIEKFMLTFHERCTFLRSNT